MMEVIGTPLAMAVQSNQYGQRNLFVASTTGLHLMQTNVDHGLRYVKTLKHGICIGVTTIDRPQQPIIDDDGCGGDKDRKSFAAAAVFNRSLEHAGRRTESEMVFFGEEALGSGNEKAKIDFRMTCDRLWGRVRKIAYSKSLDSIFLSTKSDHDFRGVYQSSSVWVSPVTYPNNGKPCTMAYRLIQRKPGNIRDMAINDNLNILALSDLRDDVNHTVDLYDSKTGELLYHLCRGVASGLGPCPDPQETPYGVVRFPRGLAFDQKNRLYVIDESKRVQKFNCSKRRCEAVIFKTRYDFPQGLAISEKELIILGCEVGGHRGLEKGCYLTVCGLNFL